MSLFLLTKNNFFAVSNTYINQIKYCYLLPKTFKYNIEYYLNKRFLSMDYKNKTYNVIKK